MDFWPKHVLFGASTAMCPNVYPLALTNLLTVIATLCYIFGTLISRQHAVHRECIVFDCSESSAVKIMVWEYAMGQNCSTYT